MSDILKKKQDVLNAYDNSPTWVAKVNKMTDQQIIAVYLRLQRTNRI